MYVKGGVTLRGKTLSTASMDSGIGSIELQGAADKKFRAESREFIFNDSTFTADQSSVRYIRERIRFTTQDWQQL